MAVLTGKKNESTFVTPQNESPLSPSLLSSFLSSRTLRLSSFRQNGLTVSRHTTSKFSKEDLAGGGTSLSIPLLRTEDKLKCYSWLR